MSYAAEDGSRKRVDMCWCGDGATPDIRCAIHRGEERPASEECDKCLGAGCMECGGTGLDATEADQAKTLASTQLDWARVLIEWPEDDDVRLAVRKAVNDFNDVITELSLTHDTEFYVTIHESVQEIWRPMTADALMSNDYERQIRERDAMYGDSVPGHWSAIHDRRYLLAALDEARQIDRSES